MIKAKLQIWLTGALVVILSLMTQTAEARNVPGSAAAATQQYYETATTDIADGIVEALNSQPNSVNVGGVSQDQTQAMYFSSIGASTQSDSGLIFGASTRFRMLDLDGEVEDGYVFTNSLLLGQRLQSGTTIFGALLYEGSDADTPFNRGTIESIGWGAALGVQTNLGPRQTLTAMFGHLWLDYDATRSGGTIAGSYDSTRWFADVRGGGEAQSTSARFKYDFGLRYVEQSDDAYTETGVGGGVVPSTSFNSTSTFVNLRTLFGSTGTVTPYVQSNLRYVFSDSSSPPGGQGSFDDGIRAYLGAGIENSQGNLSYDLGLGSHFNDDGYSGLATQLSVQIRF